MNDINPKRIALLAFQVSILIGLCIGVTCLLLPLANQMAIFGLILSALAGYALFLGYLGLSSLYLLFYHKQMNKRHAAWAAVAIGLFALFWVGIFENGYNAMIHETRSILSTFKSDKGLLTRLAVANMVRDSYKNALANKMRRDICKNEADYLAHLPILQDEGVPVETLKRKLEAGYRAVSCF